MNGATRSSDSSGNMKVESENLEDIQKRIQDGGYEFNVAGVDVQVTENQLTMNGENVGNATGGDTASSKTSEFILTGKPLIMRFNEKIQDIINGVSLKIKGIDKNKKKKVTRETKQEQEQEQNEQEQK